MKVFLLIGIFAFTLMSFSSLKSVLTEWPVPAEYKNKANPFKGDANVVKGKNLYNLHCKSCHGDLGLSNGPKANTITTEMRKFNDAAVQAQTDGELYYKSIIGRPETKMPNYERKIPVEKDRWLLVNYLRTLK